MFLAALGRMPDARELQQWQDLLKDFADPAVKNVLQDANAWKNVAHTFFNTKEFMYYR